jgi:hypothetical protein
MVWNVSGMMGWEYFNNAEARWSRIDCDSFQRGVEFFSDVLGSPPSPNTCENPARNNTVHYLRRVRSRPRESLQGETLLNGRPIIPFIIRRHTESDFLI